MVSHRRKKIRLDSTRIDAVPATASSPRHMQAHNPLSPFPRPPLRPSCTPTSSFLRRQESRGAGRALPATTPARLTRPHHPCRRGLSRKARPAPAGTPTPLTPPRRPRGRPHLFVIPAKPATHRSRGAPVRPDPVEGPPPCHRPLAPARRRTLPSRHGSLNRPVHEHRRWRQEPRARDSVLKIREMRRIEMTRIPACNSFRNS